MAVIPTAGVAISAGCLSLPFSGSEVASVLGWARSDGEYLPEEVFANLDELYYANLESEPDGTVVFPSDHESA